MIVLRTFSKKEEKKKKKGLTRDQKLALGLGVTSALALGALALKGPKVKVTNNGGHVLEGCHPKVNQKKLDEATVKIKSKWVNSKGQEVPAPTNKDSRFMYNKETGKEYDLSKMNTEEFGKILEDPNTVIQL